MIFSLFYLPWITLGLCLCVLIHVCQKQNCSNMICRALSDSKSPVNKASNIFRCSQFSQFSLFHPGRWSQFPILWSSWPDPKIIQTLQKQGTQENCSLIMFPIKWIRRYTPFWDTPKWPKWFMVQTFGLLAAGGIWWAIFPQLAAFPWPPEALAVNTRNAARCIANSLTVDPDAETTWRNQMQWQLVTNPQKPVRLFLTVESLRVLILALWPSSRISRHHRSTQWCCSWDTGQSTPDALVQVYRHPNAPQGGSGDQAAWGVGVARSYPQRNMSDLMIRW